MEESTQAIASYNAQSAKARAAMMFASTQITQITFRITQIQASLEQSIKECTAQSLAFAAQMKIINDDLEVMQKLVNATDCSKKASASNFLQCSDDDSGESFIGFGHHVARRSVMQLKSEQLRKGVRKILREAGSTLGQLSQVKPVVLTSDDRASLVPLSFLEESAVGGAPGPAPAGGEDEDENLTPAEQAKAAAKCVIGKNPNCQALNDKFVFMQADVMDKQQTLEDAIYIHNHNCKTTQENYQAQLSNLEARLKDQQAALAEATEQQNNADEQSRLETIEYKKFDTEFRRGMRECKTNIDGFENEKCSLEKVRDEVLGSPTPPMDCSVSSWVAEDCDKQCGGGKQKLTRTITTHPTNGGAKCPVLAMVRSCNEDECPVDCALGEWSGWSTCSAGCGGGVKERSRIIEQQPAHGGEQCGATSEAQSCNQQACNEPCKLGEWTHWGACSQMCDTGVKQRNRPVSVAAVGSGECPSLTDPERTEYEECNTQPCTPPPTKDGIHPCKAKLDVVLLLDGSGSLRRNGWEATKKAGEMFARAMVGGEHDIKLSVLLFSGPSNYRSLRRCINGPRGGPPVNMERECNVKWVEHLGTDTAATAGKIKALQWPARTTLTSAALAMAEAELQFGRRDAKSVVIVVTDGRPMSRHATYQASLKLRRKARLMWVPVTRYAPYRSMMQWASRPAHANVICVKSFTELAKAKNVDKIVTDMCPSIK